MAAQDAQASALAARSRATGTLRKTALGAQGGVMRLQGHNHHDVWVLR